MIIIYRSISLSLSHAQINISSIWRIGHSSRQLFSTFQALNILKEIPECTIKKLCQKGFYPQEGFIMLSLPVPPNCLRLSDYFEGKNTISSVSHMVEIFNPRFSNLFGCFFKSSSSGSFFVSLEKDS